MNRLVRQGGLKIDPAVRAFQERAAENPAALSKKQKKDRQRVRVKYDLPPALKAAIEEAAAEERTSASQLAAFVLGWAMGKWADEESEVGKELRGLVFEAKRPSKSMRFDWNLEVGS